MNILIDLAWPIVAIIAVWFVSSAIEAGFDVKRLDNSRLKHLHDTTKGLQDQLNALTAGMAEASKLEARIEKTERLLQGTAPSPSRHSQETLKRFT